MASILLVVDGADLVYIREHMKRIINADAWLGYILTQMLKQKKTENVAC